MRNTKGVTIAIEGFIIGSILGGAIALLLAPKNGRETRHDINKYARFARLKRRTIISDARNYSGELLKKAEEILDKSKTFAAGKYNGSAEGFEKEIESLKAGFNRAVEAYKNYTPESDGRMAEEIFVDFDETLPKSEGMGRRR
ncbi:MAG: YtxH domain-containing protein [Ignavibacteriaceae bacterium]